MKILVTGGAGFIGSAVVRQAIADGHEVVNLDALTYAANLANVASRRRTTRLPLRAGRHLRPRRARPDLRRRTQPDAVMHLAAESHVDRSIDGPGGLRRDQRRSAPTRCSRRRGPTGRLPAGARELPLPPRLHRRGVRLARRRRGRSPKTTPYAPELALFGLQGRLRPPGARLARDLRPAGRRSPTARTTTAPTTSPRS